MKGFWLVVAGTVIGYTLHAFRPDDVESVSNRDSVLLSRADLDQLSLAIDGLARADTSRIYRYEAEHEPESRSVLVLECSPGGDASCRLETLMHKTAHAAHPRSSRI